MGEEKFNSLEKISYLANDMDQSANHRAFRMFVLHLEERINVPDSTFLRKV